MKQDILIIFTFLLITIGSGCKKFVDINPPSNKLLTSDIFSNNQTATGAVLGIYTRMSSSNGFASGGPFSVAQLAGLSADEFLNFSYNPDNVGFLNNSISTTNFTLENFLWDEPYQYIYSANSILEGLQGTTGVSDSVKTELAGETKFVRAFCYFYLTNLFGDVPMYLTSDYQVNAVAPRTSSVSVYRQIIADLLDAQTVLGSDYSLANNQRIRPNKWAATALLARTYLYTQQWDSAEIESTSVINNTNLYSLLDLNRVFLANSSEAIWQLLSVTPNINTQEGEDFILTAPPSDVSLDTFLINAFEPNDQRKTNWIGIFTDSTVTPAQVYYFPYKYKVQASNAPPTEYSMVLRLAEQYLIRAEARAELGKFSGAQADLNAIRTRAGLPSNTSANDLSSLLSAIQHERQVELFSEWGHRWLDLKRMNTATAILSPIKSDWKATDTLYPIPEAEISSNSRITQNEGY